MKALNNYVSAACFAATAEALRIGELFGLDPSVIVDIMNVSTGKNFPDRSGDEEPCRRAPVSRPVSRSAC